MPSFTDNDADVLGKLWKTRHTGHDAIETRLINIETRQSEDGDGATSSQAPVTAAYIHLTRNASQTIAVSGEEVSWDKLHPLISPVGFPEPTLPVTEVEIPLEAYYGVKFESEWTSYTGGGTVEVRRERNGNTVRVWPTDDDPGLWTATNGDRFTDIAVVPCKPGDKLSVFLDHDDVSTQDLAKATLTIWKIETSRLPQLYEEVILAAGPLAYWRFDEPSGTNAADTAGHASGPFDGTYVGSPTLDAAGVMQDGSGSPSVDLNGSSQYVNVDPIADALVGSAANTIELWVQADVLGDGAMFGINNSSEPGWNRHVIWYNVSGQVYGTVIGTPGAAGAITAGGRHHVVATHVAATGDSKTYVDGSLYMSNNATYPSFNAADTAQVGAEYDSSGLGDFVNGKVDEVAVYDRELSAAEVAEHYNVGRGVS